MTLQQIQAEIAAGKARMEECEYLLKPSADAPVDMSYNRAYNIAARHVRELEGRRAALLGAGLEVEPEPEQVVPQASGITQATIDLLADGIAPVMTKLVTQAVDMLRAERNEREKVLIEGIGAGTFPVVRQFVAQELAPLLKRLDEQTAQIKELEARPAIKFCGTWHDGQFAKDSLVIHQGGLWISLCDAQGVPGRCKDWQLATKRGSVG